jgi:hypothetical protein
MALMLAGCGLADSHSAMPEFMRARSAEPLPPEPPPDVKRLVAEKLDSIFTTASHPAQVHVSRAIHDPRGLAWTACVKAQLTSVVGKPLGMRTYRIFIVEGAISDRREVETDDLCLTENYQPI